MASIIFLGGKFSIVLLAKLVFSNGILILDFNASEIFAHSLIILNLADTHLILKTICGFLRDFSFLFLFELTGLLYAYRSSFTPLRLSHLSRGFKICNVSR